MGYSATGEICERMLQLKHFGLYFHTEIRISATRMLGGSGACSPRKFLCFDVLF